MNSRSLRRAFWSFGTCTKRHSAARRRKCRRPYRQRSRRQRVAVSKDEYAKKADEVMTILHGAMQQVDAFYDCRMILGLLLGICSVRAGMLRQAKVLTQDEIDQCFAQALMNSEIDGPVPKI